MPRRYAYGPDAGSINVTSAPGEPPTPPDATPPAKADLNPATVTLVSSAPESVTLAFAPYDPAAVNPPSEVFALLFPSGVNPPDDPAAAVADATIPRASTTAPVPPEGATAYVVPHPVVPQGAYFGKTILAFDDPE